MGVFGHCTTQLQLHTVHTNFQAINRVICTQSCAVCVSSNANGSVFMWDDGSASWNTSMVQHTGGAINLV